MKDQIENRVDDLHKNIAGARQDLEVLTDMSRVASETKMYKQSEEIRLNTELSVKLLKDERVLKGVEGVLILMTGVLLVAFMNLITGSITANDAQTMTSTLVTIIKDNFMLWFFLAVIFWIVVAAFGVRILRRAHIKSQGTVDVRMVRKVPIDMKALKIYLRKKNILVISTI